MKRVNGWVWVLAAVLCASGYFDGVKASEGDSEANNSGRQGVTLAEVPFVEGQEPPQASGSEMWCLVTKPPRMKQSTRQVLVRPATFYYEVVPAVYEARSEQVLLEPEKRTIATIPAEFRTERVRRLVKEESYRFEVREPQYEQVSESILVKPAYFEEYVVPATYKTVCEQVETAPAHIVWRKVDCDDKDVKIVRRESRDDCYTTCLVPARIETVSRQELVSPARVERREIAAVYETRTITKMTTPATTRKVVIPAQYEEVSQEVMVNPAVNNTETIPASFQTVTKQVMVKPVGQKRVEVAAQFETVTFEEMVSPAQLVWRKTDGCPVIVKKYDSFPGGDAPLVVKK